MHRLLLSINGQGNPDPEILTCSKEFFENVKVLMYFGAELGNFLL